MNININNREKQPVETVKKTDALISSDMRIEGDVLTTSDMRVLGNIKGNVSCEGDIVLNGSIQGDVKVANLTIENGSLIGNVTAKGNVIIGEGAVLKGNMTAQNVHYNGIIEGQIQAAEEVELKKTAQMIGDVTAKYFAVVHGAKVIGVVNVIE